MSDVQASFVLHSPILLRSAKSVNPEHKQKTILARSFSGLFRSLYIHLQKSVLDTHFTNRSYDATRLEGAISHRQARRHATKLHSVPQRICTNVLSMGTQRDTNKKTFHFTFSKEREGEGGRADKCVRACSLKRQRATPHDRAQRGIHVLEFPRHHEKAGSPGSLVHGSGGKTKKGGLSLFAGGTEQTHKKRDSKVWYTTQQCRWYACR